MNARRLLPLLAPPLAIALLAAAPKSAKSPGIDVAGMDTSVKPGDDFFRYANGTWIKSTEIPADRSSWGTNAMLAEKTAKRTADLITETAKSNAAAGSEARKIGDTYNAFMDEAGIEAKGLVPLKPTLDAIASISDAAALARLLGSRVRADVDVLNSASGSRRTSRTPRATRRSSSRAASVCPIATTTSTNRRTWTRSARPITRTSRRC
jgi:putative endopeptidase